MVESERTETNNEKGTDDSASAQEPTPAPLTPAQEEAMRVMAKALHDRLDSLRGQEGNGAEASGSQPSSESQQSENMHGNSSLAPVVATAVPVQGSTRVVAPLQSTQKPPLLLDSAICILLVLLFAIICRRMV